MADNIVTSGGDYRDVERPAAGVITPGMAVEVDANDEYTPISVDAQINPLFALARENEADPSATIDTDYAADEPVRGAYPYPGMTGRALFAAGESLAVGDEVVIDGTGKFRAAVLSGTSPDDRSAVVGKAIEAGSETTDFRLEVEFY